MAETEVIADAEIVPDSSTEIVPVEHHQPANLFRTNDPAEVVQRASEVATVLKDVLAKQGLTKRIQNRDHVLVEGWTTCGAMLGVVPVVQWTRQTEKGWEARVEARTIDGRVVGAAEASCSRDESTWKARDDYALRSMAQTRATSKALRGPLGFIVTLAGFAATPEDEMPADAPTGAPQHPHGPVYTTQEKPNPVAVACVKLAGSPPKGISLYKLVVQDCGGYLPAAAATALLRAANVELLAGDVEAPEIT